MNGMNLKKNILCQKHERIQNQNCPSFCSPGLWKGLASVPGRIGNCELNWHLCIRSINCYWNKWNRTSHSNLIVFFHAHFFCARSNESPLLCFGVGWLFLYWNFYQLKCSVSPPCFNLIWGDVIALYKAAQCIRMGCHMYPLLNQSYFSPLIPP